MEQDFARGQKTPGIIIHAEGVRFAFPSSAPEGRKVFGFQDEIPDNTRTTQVAGGARAAGFAHGQIASCPLERVPVYKWCWVTLGKQSRVISRECRRAGRCGVLMWCSEPVAQVRVQGSKLL